MSTFTVGCVPYVNAVPLIAAFELEASPVRVVYEVPSRLPALLESGEIQAMLVSSIDVYLTPGRRAVEGVCIGSRGAVRSVRLFSRVPFPEIRTLALDPNSMTSNRLAQIILDQTFGSHPQTICRDGELHDLLAEADAAVLIGDRGMQAGADGLQVLDLGSAWLSLTGLPFVWALWAGGADLTEELASHLGGAIDFAEANWSAVIDVASARSNWPREIATKYLRETMTYRLDDSMRLGLEEFASRLGGVRCEPQWVAETRQHSL